MGPLRHLGQARWSGVKLRIRAGQPTLGTPKSTRPICICALSLVILSYPEKVTSGMGPKSKRRILPKIIFEESFECFSLEFSAYSDRITNETL